MRVLSEVELNDILFLLMEKRICVCDYDANLKYGYTLCLEAYKIVLLLLAFFQSTPIGVQNCMTWFSLIIGYLVITDISKGYIFNEKIYRLIRVIGTMISIGGIIIPTLGNEPTQLEILYCSIDIYKVALGISIIVLSYVIRHGQFLQEEYDTTL